MKLRQFLLSTAVALFISAPALADVQGDLNGYFGSLGFDGNVSRAQAWQGQAAGYVTGGSVYLRNQVKQVQLISMQVPTLNAGCGGIDSYLGAFSFINGAELQRFVKQIMSNAAGYAFDLALQTMVPELKQAKDFLQKLASDVNSANMSSCQAAQGIIGGLWPVTQVSNQKICQDIAGESNIFADWAASRQGCTVGGQGDSVTSRASDQMKDQVLKNKNLIWDALGRNHLFDGNNELKELVMSIIGSIVFNAQGQVTILPPMVDNRDVITVLMNGGTAKIYGCDTMDLCLGPTVATVNISSDAALVSQVRRLMLSIDGKLSSDSPLTDQEKGFINTTSVPVLKYLTNSRSMGMSPTYLVQVADFIAQDMMIQYLQELVKQASQSLAGRNYPEQAAGELRGNVLTAQSLLAQMKLQSTADQNALDGIDRNMQYLQQQVSTIISTSYQSNYQWGTGND
ncbi:conjugal transfer pilus assembly protein TraH [Pantoea allii]|uniref:Conjugal transfer protein TraH n=1 Tax=Pantoea allii TaxID=574096 RepID=A0ABS6VJA2_9GAMM|nr:conjugal transfer pilus assembly protein TraH [Pantoea allii]MBW1215837.1 conjugal transfer protein TraH [Pantoea allii]MBW1254592.1 conjugal transfer protein TraH [Pantoea allii]MBW1259419.1 conjugal transfer protein TraH [Pantoea allii]MBW1263748.1 conjugal transfer protein TraH [Pantoea allii]MBW1268535.1 conjugal transfer protein TraH [Pantoea allii]